MSKSSESLRKDEKKLCRRHRHRGGQTSQGRWASPLQRATPATMADFAGQEGGKKVRVAINGFGRVGRM